MGLGRLLTRSTVITSRNTITGATATFTITDGMAPDWASSDAYRGGMTIPGAWRAANLLADMIGGMPWDAYRSYGGTPMQLITPCPPLLEQPNPPDTRFTSFSSMALDKIWHGNAIAVIAARNAQGWPTAAIPVSADAVMVRRVTPFVDSPMPVGDLEYAIGGLRLGSADVIHIKGPCRPGAVRGMGVLETQFETLNLARTQQRQAASISQHGVPTGVLESSNPDLTDTEAAELKASWLASQGTRTVAVLNATTKFTPLSWTPDDMQMIEARKFTLGELELVFGLPVGFLGGMPAHAYSNIEQDAVNLLKFTLNGHVIPFEQTLSLAFPRGTVVKANLDWLLRTDTLTRYQAHAIALDKGFMTVDEVRELENRPPLPEPPPPDPALLPPIQAQAEVGAPTGQPAIEPRRRLPFAGARRYPLSLPPLPRRHLRYSDDQPRDEGGRFGEGGGGSSGGGGRGSIEKDYGPITEEWDPTDESLIAVHENGDISVSFKDDNGNLEPVGDFSNPDEAQQVSDWVAEAEVDAGKYDAGSPVNDNGLADYRISDSGALVGYTPDDEVAVGWPTVNADGTGNSLAGWNVHYLTSNEAEDFSNFLGQAADAAADT